MADYHSHPYLTYALYDPDCQAKLEVVPERGGMITQWQVFGRDILYMDWERFQNPKLSVRGGIPLLFPICGNLAHNTYSYNNRLYTLNQHGFARDLPWEVIDASSANALTLRLQSQDATLAQYPFIFECTVRYTLKDNCLHIQQSFANQGLQPMPFSTGLHPYFRVADKTQLELDIPSTHYFDQHTQHVAPFTGEWDWNAPELDWAFSNLQSHRAIVTDDKQGLQLMMEFDPVYSTLVFWTLNDQGFYCLEPWSTGRNALNTGTRLCLIEPGDTLHTQVAIEIQDMNGVSK